MTRSTGPIDVTAQLHRRCKVRQLFAIILWLWPAIPALGQAERNSKTDEDKSDLSRRLIDKTVKGASHDLMEEIINLMGDSAKSLRINFDPGAETQRMQQEVMDQLDIAIKKAGTQRRPAPQKQKKSESDQRKANDAKPGQSEKGKKDDSASTRNEDRREGQTEAAGNAKEGKLGESRRGWGALPQRKRDEVIQGASEAHLQQYREWIEQYYRALQEAED